MVLTDNKPSPKSKKEINKEYYQKNQAKLKSQRRDNYQQDKETEKAKRKQRYAQQKEQDQLLTQQQSAQYYQAKHIEILMPFSEYTELNKETKRLWKDFNWTLQVINESITGIVDIMKLEQVAGRLVRHYWETAKSKEKKEKSSWNLLDYDEQIKLVKYWGREKARIENNFIDTAEQLERQGDSYLKEVERAKYHEERGKIKCSCSWCQYEAEIHHEAQAKIKKDQAADIKFWEEQERKWKGTDQGGEETEWEKRECAECYENKKVSTESGLCKQCERDNGGV